MKLHEWKLLKFKVKTPDPIQTRKVVGKNTHTHKSIEKFHGITKKACDNAYKTQYTSKKTTTHKSVPWWTDELTTLRKRTNAFRRRYQRTKNDDVSTILRF